MDMLFGCLHSDRTTSWNALSTSREHKYPSPLTLRADTPVFHNKTPRAQTVPITIPTLSQTAKTAKLSSEPGIPGSGCSPKSISAVGLHPPVSVCPWTRVRQRWCLQAPLSQGQHPPCVAPGLVNEEIWQERREPFLWRNLSSSLTVSLEWGQNLALYGVITTACYFPLYSPYIKLEGIHRDPAVEESMQSLQ